MGRPTKDDSRAPQLRADSMKGYERTMPGELLTSVELEVGVAVVFHAGGYLAHCAKPVLERLFKRRFAGETAPDVQTAAQRLEPFFEELQQRVEHLEERDGLTRERIEEQFTKPEVTGAFYKAAENAMETDDTLVRRTLADLIVQRLAAPDESIWSHASRLAIERVRDLTPNEIRLLGLMSFLHEDYFGIAEFDSIADSDRDPYAEWLLKHKPLIELEREPSDLDHLSGLGLITYGPMYEELKGGFTPTVLNPVSLRFPELRVDERVGPLIAKLSTFASPVFDGHDILLAAIDLTPPAILIGAHAMREVASK